ncbi:DnaB-like helicase C-terminal domain-containing protein [Paenibacillus sp. GCM10023248]|uniref:DnaB-like helicase C-terminal domain-containing protein n=2 Tax=Bacillales TaxID=1385 RepID=UPI0023783C5F|nr:DnaB-like helicase C-terminal domain-containing protein [Paenibacillus sp. MAHUQ-63]MDD9267608.1 DnaB-like helicase C-terminal domain-containing protein [Paenibacillus sp. MAHUQ-63]MDR6884420.1 replicative DNA helicase [Bacillus sp. 3255]
MMSIDHKRLAPTLAAVDLDSLLTYYQKQMREEAYLYLHRRGITEDTAQTYRIGFEIGKIGFYVDQNQLGDYFEHRVIIPVRNYDGEIVDLIGRSIDNKEPKYKALYGLDQFLFNYQALEESDEVILCNGIFDVLSLTQAKVPSVCVPDNGVFKEHHLALFTGKRVYICMGNDDSGRRESVRIEALLREQGNETYIISLPETIRDINDLFVRAQNPVEAFLGLVQQSVEEAMLAPVAPDNKNSTVYLEEYMKRFRGQVASIRTGFAKLDNLLFGGFGSGLYLLAGAGAIGKSMLLKQMADHIALEETPVIYVSWDMTNFELWSRSIARILGVEPQKVLGGKVDPEQVAEANKQYGRISKMLWMLECTMNTTLDQVAASIERIALIVGKEPVIFIDHLQRIPAGEGAAALTWQQQQAAIAYTLKQWSREWDCPIIAATALELGQGNVPDRVQASADVVMIMQPGQAEVADAQAISLALTKNRNGTTGNIPLLFHNDRALFTE